MDNHNYIIKLTEKRTYLANTQFTTKCNKRTNKKKKLQKISIHLLLDGIKKLNIFSKVKNKICRILPGI